MKDTYIYILKDITFKKLNVLEQILELTHTQETIIAASPFSYDLFLDSITKKELLVKELEKLDEGFEKIYSNIQEEINDNRFNYKNDIQEIQEAIKQIMDRGLKLSALEAKLELLLQTIMIKQKSEISNYKLNRKVVNQYNPYQNQNITESYFFDKKK